MYGPGGGNGELAFGGFGGRFDEDEYGAVTCKVYAMRQCAALVDGRELRKGKVGSMRGCRDDRSSRITLRSMVCRGYG